MRFVDDFLLITREPEIARQFLTAVSEGKYIMYVATCMHSHGTVNVLHSLVDYTNTVQLGLYLCELCRDPRVQLQGESWKD